MQINRIFQSSYQIIKLYEFSFSIQVLLNLSSKGNIS